MRPRCGPANLHYLHLRSRPSLGTSCVESDARDIILDNTRHGIGCQRLGVRMLDMASNVKGTDHRLCLWQS